MSRVHTRLRSGISILGRRPSSTLHEFKLRTSIISKTRQGQISDLGRIEKRQHKRTGAIDYSRMNYEELLKIADNDAIADKMSNEEYESLSVELWKRFSIEKLTHRESPAADAANTWPRSSILFRPST
jgi:hypothetical protein